jgi:hypothetical protein
MRAGTRRHEKQGGTEHQSIRRCQLWSCISDALAGCASLISELATPSLSVAVMKMRPLQSSGDADNSLLFFESTIIFYDTLGHMKAPATASSVVSKHDNG